MRWTWAIRLMVLGALVVAFLEAEEVVHPFSRAVGLAILGVCAVLQLLLVYTRR